MATIKLPIVVDVPMATCCCVDCPTPPEPYIPGLINIDYSKDQPVYTAGSLVLPDGWILISVQGITGPCCPFDQQVLDKIISIMPDNLAKQG